MELRRFACLLRGLCPFTLACDDGMQSESRQARVRMRRTLCNRCPVWMMRLKAGIESDGEECMFALTGSPKREFGTPILPVARQLGKIYTFPCLLGPASSTMACALALHFNLHAINDGGVSEREALTMLCEPRSYGLFAMMLRRELVAMESILAECSLQFPLQHIKEATMAPCRPPELATLASDWWPCSATEAIYVPPEAVPRCAFLLWIKRYFIRPLLCGPSQTTQSLYCSPAYVRLREGG